MSATVKIALDAMGGDRGPEMVVAGAGLARVRHPEVRFLLFGDEKRMAPLLRRDAELAKACEIRHTTEAVGPEDKPSRVPRRVSEAAICGARTTPSNRRPTASAPIAANSSVLITSVPPAAITTRARSWKARARFSAR